MQWLNYHHLYYFWKIAQLGSISAASDELKTTQSTLSNQLKQLEHNFGFSLFDRIGRKLVLTDEGRYILKKASEIFERGDNLINEVKNSHIGHTQKTIRVGAVSTLSKNIQQVFLNPILKSDKVKILDVYSSNQTNLVDKLGDFDIDFIITNYLDEIDFKKYQAHKIESFPLHFVHSLDDDMGLVEKIKEYGLLIPTLSYDQQLQLEIFFQKNNIDKSYIKSKIEDTALLRLFATQDSHVVLIPSIGVHHDLLEGKLISVARLKGANETFYVIARKNTYELLNLDILIAGFRKIFKERNYEN